MCLKRVESRNRDRDLVAKVTNHSYVGVASFVVNSRPFPPRLIHFKRVCLPDLIVPYLLRLPSPRHAGLQQVRLLLLPVPFTHPLIDTIPQIMIHQPVVSTNIEV
jgi:hypothetical protein